MTVPSLTINKVCLSGLDAIALAAQLIRAGEFDVVVAGGMESMTQAPHLLPWARRGIKYGSAELIDAMAHDGLTDAFDHVAMGESTERHNARLGDQPGGAGRVRRAVAPARPRWRSRTACSTDEIVAVPVPQRRGEPVIFDHRRGRSGRTLRVDVLGRLRPAFAADGTITAGSASQISDGACAVVVMSAEAAAPAGLARAGRDRRARQWWPGRTTRCSPSRPAPSSTRWARPGCPVADLDLIEINEAFAAVAIQSMRDLGIGPDNVNVNGGAIAIGHPIGASGARLALHLIYELRRRGGGLGVAALCGGGGQGDALLLRVPPAGD